MKWAALVFLVCSPSYGAAYIRMSTAPPKPRSGINRRFALSTFAAAAATTACPPSPAAAAEAVVDANKIKTTPSGARYVTVKEGKCPASDFTGTLGSCFPSKGAYAIVDYTAFLPSGQVFDTTEKKGGKPLAFRIGESQVIKGMEEVVVTMKPGQEVQALIPANLAYGSKGVCTENGECLVPPDTNLKYFLRLLRVTISAG